MKQYKLKLVEKTIYDVQPGVSAKRIQLKALSTLERHEASPCAKFWLFHYDAMKLRRASHRPVEHGGADASWSLELLRIDSWSK